MSPTSLAASRAARGTRVARRPGSGCPFHEGCAGGGKVGPAMTAPFVFGSGERAPIILVGRLHNHPPGSHNMADKANGQAGAKKRMTKTEAVRRALAEFGPVAPL